MSLADSPAQRVTVMLRGDLDALVGTAHGRVIFFLSLHNCIYK